MASQPTERILFVVLRPEPVEELNKLRERFPSYEITYIAAGLGGPATWGKDDPEKDVYKDKTILVTLWALPPTPEDAPDLRYIHFISSGTNHLAKHPVFNDPSITMTFSRGVAGPTIAEWVIMTALVHGHKYNHLIDSQRNHEWNKDHATFWQTRDMIGQRIGLLGYGGIGRHVGRVAKAMGMEVYAYTASPKDTPEKRRDNDFCVPNTGDPEGEFPVKWFSGLDKPSLHEFLQQDLDIVVLGLPLTDETTHLLSTEEFEILSKKKALVINVSRGAIIDQPALVKALHDGKLRGAAVDVTDPEPLPADDALWDAPNVIISPHVTGLFEGYFPRVFSLLLTNLERRAAGERLLNTVAR